MPKKEQIRWETRLGPDNLYEIYPDPLGDFETYEDAADTVRGHNQRVSGSQRQARVFRARPGCEPPSHSGWGN